MSRSESCSTLLVVLLSPHRGGNLSPSQLGRDSPVWIQHT